MERLEGIRGKEMSARTFRKRGFNIMVYEYVAKVTFPNQNYVLGRVFVIGKYYFTVSKDKKKVFAFTIHENEGTAPIVERITDRQWKHTEI